MDLERIKSKIIIVRNEQVIVDCDVADIYGVQTKELNQAVRNNPKKFPEGYILDVQSAERQELVKNFDRFENIKHSISTKAFTEKGLYMLATILKSERAIDATIEIVEAFSKMREFSRNLAMLSSTESEIIEPELLESTSNLFHDMFLSHFPTTSTETSLEFNLGMIKGKRTLKSEPELANLTKLNNVLQSKIDRMEKMIEQLVKNQK
jgi:phage regulator Rha-like protein